MPHAREPQRPSTALEEFKELRRETRQHFEAMSRRLDTLATTIGRPRAARQEPRHSRGVTDVTAG